MWAKQRPEAAPDPDLRDVELVADEPLDHEVCRRALECVEACTIQSTQYTKRRKERGKKEERKVRKYLSSCPYPSVGVSVAGYFFRRTNLKEG